MSNLDYIKSYLVKLGVDINSNEIAKWDSSLKKMDKGFKSTVKGLASSYSKIAGIYATLTLGISKFVGSIAQSDMEMQKFARRMYMSRDSAKALQTTLDAMGLDGISDLQDVALNPELMKQYRELISLSQSLNTPDAIKSSLKDIRAISFEFDKIRTIFTYFSERVAYFIYRTLGEPSRKFHKFLIEFNNIFSKNITNWAETLGRILGSIVRLSLRFGEAIVFAVKTVKQLWDSLSGFTKGFIGAIFLINRILQGSPIWKLVTVFTTFLMLLDDYKTYKEGGISAKVLKPVWSFIDEQRENPESGWNTLVNFIRELIIKIDLLVSKIGEFLTNIQNSKIGKWLGLDTKPQKTYSGSILPTMNSLGFNYSAGELESRLNNLPITPIAHVDTNRSLNYTPVPGNTDNSENITQNFIFNVTGINNPGQFVNEAATLIRNNKSRFVG